MTDGSAGLVEAHHTERGFRNPWPGGVLPPFRSLLRWGLERRVRPPPPDPDPRAFRRATPSFMAPRAGPDHCTVTWIGHSATLIQIGGVNVLTDPMLTRRASPVRFAGPRRWVPPGIELLGLPPIDVVAISHNHYDHLDTASVHSLTALHPAAHWIAPLRLADWLAARGAGQITEFDWWERRSIASLTVTAIPAQHFSGRSPFDRNRSLWLGWAFAGGAPERRVLFAGDTGYHPEFGAIGERTGPLDLVMLPIGAYAPRWFMRPVHLDPEDAVRAYADLTEAARRGVMMAIHWGTFKLTDEPMDEPPARARTAWLRAGLPEERLWIPRHGETRSL